MRNRIWLGLVGLSFNTFAQTPWVLPGNNGINPATDYLGTQNNADLVLRTNATERFRLLPDATYTIGSFASQVRDGSLVLCPKVSNFYGNGANGPFSLLHLAALDYNAQDQSARDWMNTGITFTGNGDQEYVGQKAGEEEEFDYTDMIIQWSDNPGEYLKDRMRFLFTSGYDGNATSGAQSREGLEFMRMFPSRYDEPFIGIGDFYAANLANSSITEPEERLDVVNGKVRIRQLPLDQASQSNDFVVVSGTGVLEHRPITSLPDNCEWEMSTTSPNHVYTAWGTSNSQCPDDAENVGIGLTVPEGKLHVVRNPIEDNTNEAGIWSETFVGGTNSGTGSTSYAVRGDIHVADNDTPCDLHIGSEGVADGALVMNAGVRGIASSDTDINDGNRGVVGEASGDGDCYGVYGHGKGSGAWNYGVYGTSSTTATNNWAGWFQGNVTITNTLTVNTTVYTSDAALKENVLDLPAVEADQALMDLRPVMYDFNQDEYGYLTLPQGPQVGLIAQEVEAVLPELVHGTVHPAVHDGSGNLIHAELPIKGINYVGLIPYLIAGYQEQQQRIASLEEQLTACCNADGDRAMRHTTGPTAPETDLRIIPNPVADQTELRYTVGEEGRVRLEITDASGRTIQTQDEGARSTGTFSYGWNTTLLAPGTYHCTLYVNDEPLVQKAVKLNVR